jgi:4-hydroxybenzoate polyprenyltransferase
MFGSILYAIRPSACAGVALFAASAFRNYEDVETFTLILIATFLGSAACFLIGDIHDTEKDRLNNKQRPIVSGNLSKGEAWRIAVGLLVVYIVISAYLGAEVLAIAMITTVIFFAYPFVNNRFGFLANVIVAICVMLSFVYGAALGGFSVILIYLMLSAFWVTISREIMLDALDIEGDRLIGKSSIPMAISTKATKAITRIGFTLGSLPIVLIILSGYLDPGWGSLLLASLWLPTFVNYFKKETNWFLFNIRTSHVFFGIIIVILLTR